MIEARVGQHHRPRLPGSDPGEPSVVSANARVDGGAALRASCEDAAAGDPDVPDERAGGDGGTRRAGEAF